MAFLPVIRADPGAPILSAATRRNGVPSLTPVDTAQDVDEE